MGDNTIAILLEWVAITKNHRFGDLNKRHLILMVMDARKPINVPIHSFLGKGSFCHLTVCLQVFFVWPILVGGGERQRPAIHFL
jgi:hypothetical protein